MQKPLEDWHGVFFSLIHIFVSKKISKKIFLICDNFEKNLFNLVELCKINQVGLV